MSGFGERKHRVCEKITKTDLRKRAFVFFAKGFKKVAADKRTRGKRRIAFHHYFLFDTVIDKIFLEVAHARADLVYKRKSVAGGNEVVDIAFDEIGYARGDYRARRNGGKKFVKNSGVFFFVALRKFIVHFPPGFGRMDKHEVDVTKPKVVNRAHDMFARAVGGLYFRRNF